MRRRYCSWDVWVPAAGSQKLAAIPSSMRGAGRGVSCHEVKRSRVMGLEEGGVVAVRRTWHCVVHLAGTWIRGQRRGE